MVVKNTFFYPKQTLNCAGKLLDISTPKVMGILNVSPDSFYDGKQSKDEKSLFLQMEKMISEGADIIDVGGISTRPGAKTVSEKEELKRVIPALKILKKKFNDTIISIDTFRGEVARAAVEEGAGIVNDISAGNMDKKLFRILPALNVPYVLMHMKGVPLTMQQNPSYQNVVEELMDFFIEKTGELRMIGIKDIIIDPGFGFGKNLEHNYRLLNNLHNFKIFNLPILVGLSRKSMICKALKVNPEKALNGTTALHTLALLQGAKILRVHDVKEAREVIQLMNYYDASPNLN